MQITTKNLEGNGLISLKGGRGSTGGGGGGSGGRLVMNYLRPYVRTSYPDMSFNWVGSADFKGGEPGSINEQYLAGNKG